MRTHLSRSFVLISCLWLGACGSDDSSDTEGAGGAGAAGASAGGSAGGTAGKGGAAGSSAGTGGAAGSSAGAAGKGGAAGGGASGAAGSTAGQGGSSGSSGQGGESGAAGGGAAGAAGGTAGGAAGSTAGGAAGEGAGGAAGEGAGGAGAAGAAGAEAGGAAGAGAGGAGGAAGGAGAAGSGLGGQAAFCAGQGSTIPVPGQDACTGDLASKTFLFSLCSCSPVTSNNKITTDSLDSDAGQSTGKNGSVGIVGNYQGQQASISGSLWVDGDISTFNQHTVAVDLQCGGTLTTNSSPFAVGQDAFVEGDVVKADGKVTVGKALHQPAGKSSAGVVGTVVKEPVTVGAPCDCGSPIDIAGIVAAGQQISDNEASQVSATELKGLTAQKSLTLPCGRFAFDTITSTSSVTVTLSGRTAIFVKGDVHVAGPLAFVLEPGAELDLFIDGSLLPDNQVTIGDTMRPAATRVYVSGQAQLSGQLTIGANLYLPNAQFQGNNSIEMWGALYAKGLNLAGPITVHYDEAILEVLGCQGGAGGAGGAAGASGAGGAAGSGDDPCGSCKDCDGATPACKGGECKPCTADADCCPPLACEGGLCVVPGGKP